MIEKDDLSMLLKIAHMARRHGYLSLSERLFQHLHYAYPLRAFPHLGLGLTYFDAARHAQACGEFEKAMRLGVINKELFFAYGICSLACGNHKVAGEAFNKVMQMDKEDGNFDMTESLQALFARPELQGLDRYLALGGK